MRNGALLSGLLHGLVILLLFVGLPDFLRRDLEPPPVIPIEIINISDVTKAEAFKAKPKNDAPKEEPKEEEKPTPPKPTPPEPEPEPEKKPEPEPEKQPEPEPEKAPEPELTMDDLLAPLEKEKPKEEKPQEKPKEKPKKKKPKSKKAFTSLLNNIEKTEASSEGKTQPDQDESSTADHAANTIGELSITELDLIRRQLSACWNVPAGAKDGKELNVDIKIELNPDATVRSATITKTSKPISDPYMRALADSARRAVQNPKCSPLQLPLDRYDQWKTITIGFNPQGML